MFLQSFIVFIILLLSFPFYIKMPIGYNAVPCRAIQEFGIALELECARQDFAWLAGTDANARFDDVEVSVMIMSDITLLNRPGMVCQPDVCHVIQDCTRCKFTNGHVDSYNFRPHQFFDRFQACLDTECIIAIF